MAIREGDVIVVTTPYIPGYRVVKVIGITLGITVRSRGQFRFSWLYIY